MISSAKRKWAILIGVFIIAFGLALIFDLPKQLKIDRCLDSGGKFNYELNVCEHS